MAYKPMQYARKAYETHKAGEGISRRDLLFGGLEILAGTAVSGGLGAMVSAKPVAAGESNEYGVLKCNGSDQRSVIELYIDGINDITYKSGPDSISDPGGRERTTNTFKVNGKIVKIVSSNGHPYAVRVMGVNGIKDTNGDGCYDLVSKSTSDFLPPDWTQRVWDRKNYPNQ
jgi:hypothetical protein